MSYGLVYNGVRIAVDPTLFAANSTVFASIYSPESRDVMQITSDVPIELFQEFLKAAQGEDIAITADNVEEMSSMAEQWGVESLTEKCQRFSQSPAQVIQQLLAAIARRDADEVKNQETIIAKEFDKYAVLPEIGQVPMRNFTNIVKAQCLKVNDWRTHFLAVISIINSRREKSSSLLNTVDLETLTEEDIAAVLNNPNVDQAAAGMFMLKCARKMADDLMKLREKTHRRDHIEQEIMQKTMEAQRLREKLSAEKAQHQADVDRLNELYAQYEPGKTAEVATSEPWRKPYRGRQKPRYQNRGSDRPRGGYNRKGGGHNDRFVYIAPD